MTDKHGYVLVYSLNDADSLRQLYPYIETLEQVNVVRECVPPVVIVGNKKDLLVRFHAQASHGN
jgi:GTPase SAR1 family protein